MIWQAWLFVGAVALLMTYVVLSTAADDVAILAGVTGLLAWLLFAFESFYVVVQTDPNNVLAYAYAPVAAWAVMLALINVYVLITGPASMAARQRTNPGVNK